MKNLIKLTGVFILITLIAFTITSCPEPVDHEGFMAGSGGTPDHIHNYSAWKQTKAPTETQDGVESRTCSNNPVHSETRSIPALNHTCIWGAWAVTTAATCTTAAEEKRTCTLNGAHYETQISGGPLGHEWGIWTSTFLEGVETRECTHDSDHKETRTGTGSAALPIKSTADWNSARTLLNGKTGDYTLTIDGTFDVSGSLSNTFGSTSGLNVTLKGSGKLIGNGGILLIISSGQTLVIDSEDLTFEGGRSSGWSLVYVNGTLELNSGTISKNSDGGVYVNEGTFIMNGGTISDNKRTTVDSTDAYGGVYVGRSATFIMNGGTISGNTATAISTYCSGVGSGGVYVYGTFIMNGGTISGNTATCKNNSSGGVYVSTLGTFIMNGGTISGNTATGNDNSSGGVFIFYPFSSGTLLFRIVNGTIHGLNESITTLRNTTDGSGSAFNSTYAKAEYGTFSGTTWNSNGVLNATDNTIKVVNGVLQP
jgi:hypothetical protein